jgi:dihydropteroate synthase
MSRSLAPTRCGDHWLHWGQRTYLMGIVNVTPDSFSGDGRAATAEAVAHGLALVRAGADLLDVGGESTRPGAVPVPAEVEQQRVVPVIERLAAEVGMPISIDTFKATTAAAALRAGASLVNDTWGLRHDPAMAGVIAAHGAAVICMHNRTTPPLVSPGIGGHYAAADYGGDLIAEVLDWLGQSLALADRAGIAQHQVIVDPGIGFGKGLRQNLEVIRRLAELHVLGRPLLLGASRKSFIGRLLGSPPDDRREGTAATLALGIAAGVDIVRVHDVAAMARVVRVADAIVRGRLPDGLAADQ